MIAGYYTLTPLQQPLSILSTILTPSKASYPIFAPTSHPIPVIESVDSRHTLKSPLLNKIPVPSTFMRHDGKTPRTIFLIREHGCGIADIRLGAVPNFANIWLSHKGSWGLRNVHPVRLGASVEPKLTSGYRIIPSSRVPLYRSSILDIGP